MHITEEHYNNLSQSIMDRVQALVDRIAKEKTHIYSAYIEGALANALTGILARRIAHLVVSNPSSKDPSFVEYLIAEAMRPFIGQLEAITQLLVKELTGNAEHIPEVVLRENHNAKVIPFLRKTGTYRA